MDSKRCCTCKQDLAVSEFNLRAAAVDGLQWRCHACGRVWYEQNRESHIKAVRRRNDRARVELWLLLAEYLDAHPCVDCGERDLRCLEFDHRDPSEKHAQIALLVSNSRSWTVVLREIEKCDVRCANCHRRRTARQVNSWRHRVFFDGIGALAIE